MIEKDQLPEDPADWRDFEVSLPRLDPDTAESCPVALSEVIEYVGLESAEGDDADSGRLSFLRTAQVADQKCWLWSYIEADGELCYVTYWVSPSDGGTLGLADAKADPDSDRPQSPEQFLLAEYYDLVYW